MGLAENFFPYHQTYGFKIIEKNQILSKKRRSLQQAEEDTALGNIFDTTL